ncbi:MAG TPA: maleylpyruvate isomerase family mycothiol-dependent enzyme [Mycobacteriales bacterium]|nr:maleylpyruvate isomerase family mycothiol-dependent enzyme [Mycobacteriales bacterium]
MTSQPSTIDDLEAEQDAIEALVAPLDQAALAGPSAAAGWSIADVMLHLAQSEEAVWSCITGESIGNPFRAEGSTTDEIVANWVAAERGDPVESVERWRRARRNSIEALRSADPQVRYPWVAAPLRPAALATTRLAEHWAHAHDIAGPLGVDYPDTDRLRHIAWLGHRTLPYAFGLAGLESQPVYCELTAPDGHSRWTYGDPAAPSRITGAAGAFCRVGAQRLAATDSGLVTEGPHAATALRLLRNYAG